MADLLDCYFAQERMKEFDWGRDNGDCLLFLAGWGERLGLDGIGRPWRTRYSDEAGARAFLTASGGAVKACCQAFGSPLIGSEPRRGDVGLLEIDGWHLGMICTGRMWALRVKGKGIGMIQRRPHLVWALGFQ